MLNDYIIIIWSLTVFLCFVCCHFSDSKTATATHSSTLAWKIPWTEEPGRLQSMGSRRVRHDWETSLSLFTFMHWRRKWQPTPLFLLGESQGWGSLVGCHLWGRTESDTTDWSNLAAAAAAAAAFLWLNLFLAKIFHRWEAGRGHSGEGVATTVGSCSVSICDMI